VEFFREPDVQIGFLAGGVTMGQLLSLPVLAAGVWLLMSARGRVVQKVYGEESPDPGAGSPA
jgi:phosphatidylglycerol:prolipoprotein diacylglycerol transferase